MGFFSSIVNKITGSAIGKIVASVVPFLSPILSFVSIATTAITWLRKPDEPEFNFDSTPENIAKGVLVNKTSANGQIPIIYGTRKVGGTIAFLETSGTDNQSVSYTHLTLPTIE